jgi:hypothetical protein
MPIKTTKREQSMLEFINTRLNFKPPAKSETRTNPYTGKKHLLEPIACQLYDFITTRYYVCGKDYTRLDWDTARMMFLKNWPDEDYDLID